MFLTISAHRQLRLLCIIIGIIGLINTHIQAKSLNCDYYAIEDSTVRLAIDGLCVGDSLVEFTIKGLGEVDRAWEFIIIEDVWLRESGTIQINGTDSTKIQFKGSGKKIRLQIPNAQANGDTLESVVEHCGSTAIQPSKVDSDSSDIELRARCVGDSIARFIIVNTGDGAMTTALDFIIIEDVWLWESGTFQLPSLDSLILEHKPQYQRMQLEIPKALDTLRIAVEGCGVLPPKSYMDSSSVMPSITEEADTSSLTKKTDKRQTAFVGLIVGTVGAGLSFGKSISKHWTFRLNGTYLPLQIKPDWSYSELAELVIDAEAKTLGFLVDWYPSKKSPHSKFHLTAGIYGNFSKLKAYAAPDVDALINHPCKDEFVLGDATLIVRPQKTNPYMGIGFGRLPKNKKRIGLKLDLGVFYMGKPEVELITTGALRPTASQADIIADNISDYRWLPNANLTLAFCFGKK